MKTVLFVILAAAACAGCNTTITDQKTPKRNNSASDFANLANEAQARDSVMFHHGNADRP